MNKQEIIKQIIEKSPSKYKDLIKQAIEYAELKHNNEKRLSGEDFVLHPLKASLTLAELSCDTDTLIATILHSCFKKDVKNSLEIKNVFGEDVFNLISKTKEISKATASVDTDPEIITKYILNTSTDLRPVLVKLAGAAHNVETLEYLPEELRKSKILKSFNVYGKLAEYINLGELKKQIEENAFKTYKPYEYETITKTLKANNIDDSLLKKYMDALKDISKSVNENIKIEGRIKSKYSIYNKLRKYEKEWINPRLDRIADLIGFRLIAQNEEDCYKILEKIMDQAELIYEKFDDYIAHPKPNNYMAMQGPVVFPKISDIEVEVQILTESMHYTNTYGTASHIAYKASLSRFAKPNTSYDWVECIHNNFENHKKMRDEYRSIPIQCKIFEKEKFVFTPKGKIVDLDFNDTVLDFAFKVHSEIGYSAIAAKIENKAIPLSYIPKTGDVIHIITQKGKVSQNEKALKFVNSPSSKAKIIKALNRNK